MKIVVYVGSILVIMAALVYSLPKIEQTIAEYTLTNGCPDPQSEDSKAFVLSIYTPDLLYLIAKNGDDGNLSRDDIRKEIADSTSLFHRLSAVYNDFGFSVANIFLKSKDEELQKVICTGQIVSEKYRVAIPVEFALQKNELGQVQVQGSSIIDFLGSLIGENADVERFNHISEELFKSKIVSVNYRADSLFESELKKRHQIMENEIEQILGGEYSNGGRTFRIRNGGESGIDKGAVVIIPFQDKIKLYIKVSSQNGYSGEIQGDAVRVDEQVFQVADQNGCKVTIRYLDENSVQIVEDNCGNYHGANIGFDGTYFGE